LQGISDQNLQMLQMLSMYESYLLKISITHYATFLGALHF